MRNRKILISSKLVFVFAICFSLLAVFPARAQFRFDSWTTDDGLPQNTVFSIAQTPDGYLWLATLDGLVRFDGVRFTVFNHSNSPDLVTNRLRDVYVGAGGELWITSENAGLIRYRDGEFKTFTVADGLRNNDVNNVQSAPNGDLLISTIKGLSVLRGERIETEREQDFRGFRVYVAPASGTRWEISADGLLARRADGQTARYDLPFEPKPGQFDENFNFFNGVRLFEDDRQRLWISARGRLFCLHDGEFKVYAAAQNRLPQSLIKAIGQDGGGAIWVGSEKDGACRLDDDKFVCYSRAEGLSSNHVTGFLLDREKTLWIGTNDGGINRFSSQVIEPFSTAQGLLDKNVYPILQTRAGDFWIGAFSALSKVENGKVTNYTRGRGVLYEIVQSLFEDRNGAIWAGSIGGVQRIENGAVVDFTARLGFQVGEVDFWDIHQTTNGALWFATSKGVVRFQNGAAQHLAQRDGLPDNDVKVLHEARDGSLWLGTVNGAARLSRQLVEADNLNDLAANENGDAIRVYTARDGLAGDYVRSITEDEADAIWFGTYDSGLSRFKNGKFVTVNHENGLFSNGVFAILPDARGNFWMSSNQGIYRASRQQLNDFADGKISSIVSTAFDKSDGMLSTECNGGRQPAAIEAADGKLWFATQNGAAIVDPEAVAFNRLAPPVVIESASVDNQKLDNSAIRNRQSAITLAPGQNNLEINYTGLSFIKPEQIRFRYKLEGLDADWTEAGARRAAFYPYLPPGEYTFRVTAANSDSVWNETGATVKILVNPPFYRTWWFTAASAFAVALAAFGIYRRRISQLERARLAQQDFSSRLINAHEAERRRVAAELHDSIGQTLAMIKNRAVFGAQANEFTAKEQLAAITAQTTQAIGEVREISYNLRPYLLENLGLTKAIKSLVGKFEEVHLLNIDARIDDIDDLFAAEAEMSVYRIVQESLNNVAKHAEAEAAVLRIENLNSFVTIKIEDEGRGFDRSAAPKTDADSGGFGLLGITERVRMLGGSLAVQTAVGKGTKLTIKIRASGKIIKQNNG